MGKKSRSQRHLANQGKRNTPIGSVRAMKLSQLQGSLKRFRRTPWRFQQTFQTPLKNLKPFVATISSVLAPIGSASVTIDQAAFEPKPLIGFLPEHHLP